LTPLSAPLPPPPRRFAPQPVGLEEFASMVRETAALLGVAPGRLCGLFLMVFLPVQLVSALPFSYAVMPLRFAIAAVGLAGYYAVLESLRNGRPASVSDMLLPWRLAPDKVVLLVASGLVPLLAVLLAWWFDLGWDVADAFLSGQVPSEGLPVRQEIEFVLVLNLVGTPLLFVQPLCVLYAWTGTRTLAANLLAFAANWRWALILTLVSIPIAIGLDAFDPKTVPEILLSLAADVAVEMGLGAFTFVLLQRSLR
jgi:hypothetical protein